MRNILPAEAAAGVQAGHVVEGVPALQQPFHAHDVGGVEHCEAGQRQALSGECGLVRAAQTIEDVQGGRAPAGGSGNTSRLSACAKPPECR